MVQLLMPSNQEQPPSFTLRCRARGTNRRAGFTLFELLVVVAVIVLVAGLSVPAFQRSFKSQRLKKAADIVRGEWSRTKINAIRNGEEFAFFYEPETGTYWIAPFSSVYSEEGQSNTVRSEAADNYDYGNGMLPRGIVFDVGQTVEDSRSMAANEEGSAAGTANMILFYPDGTCQDAELYLKNDEDLAIRISIRSLTGVASVGQLESRASGR